MASEGQGTAWVWEPTAQGRENDHLYITQIVHVIKLRIMRWAGHVARMGEERGCIESWWGKRKERDHWEDLGVDGWIILGFDLHKVGCSYMDWIGLTQDRDR